MTHAELTDANDITRIVEYYPSRDSENAVIRPLPKAQRLLSDPTCLSYIIQVNVLSPWVSRIKWLYTKNLILVVTVFSVGGAR